MRPTTTTIGGTGPNVIDRHDPAGVEAEAAAAVVVAALRRGPPAHGDPAVAAVVAATEEVQEVEVEDDPTLAVTAAAAALGQPLAAAVTQVVEKVNFGRVFGSKCSPINHGAYYFHWETRLGFALMMDTTTCA